jgi:hypothetical protein
VIRFALPVRLVAACLVAAAAACTPMRWEHPQLGIANADADMQECDLLAWRESWRYAYGFNAWHFPRYHRGRDGRLYYYRHFPGPHHDAFFEEMRLRDYCMRSKGYRAVPVPG